MRGDEPIDGQMHRVFFPLLSAYAGWTSLGLHNLFGKRVLPVHTRMNRCQPWSKAPDIAYSLRKRG